MAKSTTAEWQEATRIILEALDIRSEYSALGVNISSESPNSKGWLSCYAHGRDEGTPSAGINVGDGPDRGRYHDFGGNGENLSFFDFVARTGRFATWSEVRKHFADQTATKLPGTKPPKHPGDYIEFLPWNDVLVQLWCRHKPGVTLESVRRAGGRLAKWPRKSPQACHVIALPAFGEQLLSDDPCRWVIYHHANKKLALFAGKGKPPKLEKVLTIGPDPGILGRAGLEQLATCDTVWSVEGPTDMMALDNLIQLASVDVASANSSSPTLANQHIAITNSNGANETPPAWLGPYVAGKQVVVIRDADEPGETGGDKWAAFFAKSANVVKRIRLPYSIEEKHGKDLRDWIADGHTFADLLALADAAEVVDKSAVFNGDAASTTTSTPAIAVISNAETILSVDGPSISPLPMSQVVSSVFEKTANWPRRANELLFIHDVSTSNKTGDATTTSQPEQISWITSPPALFGWLQRSAGVIEWHRKSGCVTKEETYSEILRTATRYAAVETIVHEPPIPGHYYACEIPEPGDGALLSALVDRFNPETEWDRELIIAMFVTPFWGGAGGTRPAFVITSDAGRGSGKSKLAAIAGYLAGGFLDFSANDTIGDIKARLLSPDGIQKRLAILDNVKSHRFSWAELEGLITTPIISGKRMYVGEGTRPNSLTWILTLNGVALSTDMATRTVTIKISRPDYAGTFYEDAVKFIDEHRPGLIADIVGLLRRPRAPLTKYSRWASWESDILSRLTDPKSLQSLILSRQNISDVEQEEAEIILEFFAKQLESLGYSTDREEIHIPSDVITRWYNWVNNTKEKTQTVSRILKQFSDEGKMSQLKQNPCRTNGRGFLWCGDFVDRENSTILYDLPQQLLRKREEDRDRNGNHKQESQSTLGY